MPSSTPCAQCPLRPRPAFIPMTEDEAAFMQRIKIGELTVAPGTVVVMEGHSLSRIYTTLSGMGLRYKTLEDGRRQVLNFVFPGDLIALQSVLMKEALHSVEATTEMTFCIFERDALWKTFRSEPERAYALIWAVAVDEHFLGQALASLGQRDAAERLAWALVRIHARLRALGLERDGSVPFPYRQQDLADALGLSLVHTNKVLARLRQKGLAIWSGGRLALPDPATLEALAVMEGDEMLPKPLF